ncbi:GNAT family N-acetyltransferase [Nocardiopsis sp. Huas11]|uniref:GNAT family N-acetyltransferase n=1 Tax=Nocardiopsis sp. Huas11 TaxID=2183912 RepID=UPI0021072768|nr:GNAT family protein [Nocardiopsis sp. Huas11]
MELGRTAEFVLVIASEARGTGVGTVATRMTLDYAFHIIGLEMVWLKVLEPNAAGRRAYAKAGFQEVGTVRSAGQWMGRRCGEVVMDALPEDLPTISVFGRGPEAYVQHPAVCAVLPAPHRLSCCRRRSSPPPHVVVVWEKTPGPGSRWLPTSSKPFRGLPPTGLPDLASSTVRPASQEPRTARGAARNPAVAPRSG